MSIRSINSSYRIAARIGGFLYIFTDATAIFAVLYVRAHLIAYANPASTVTNIAASEKLFRVGIASELVTYAGVIALSAIFYFLLRPVKVVLALLGAFWRLAENAVLLTAMLRSLMYLN